MHSKRICMIFFSRALRSVFSLKMLLLPIFFVHVCFAVLRCLECAQVTQISPSTKHPFAAWLVKITQVGAYLILVISIIMEKLTIIPQDLTREQLLGSTWMHGMESCLSLRMVSLLVWLPKDFLEKPFSLLFHQLQPEQKWSCNAVPLHPFLYNTFVVPPLVRTCQMCNPWSFCQFPLASSDIFAMNLIGSSRFICLQNNPASCGEGNFRLSLMNILWGSKKKLKLRTFLTLSVANLTSALVSSEHFKMYVTDECWSISSWNILC